MPSGFPSATQSSRAFCIWAGMHGSCLTRFQVLLMQGLVVGLNSLFQEYAISEHLTRCKKERRRSLTSLVQAIGDLVADFYRMSLAAYLWTTLSSVWIPGSLVRSFGLSDFLNFRQSPRACSWVSPSTCPFLFSLSRIFARTVFRSWAMHQYITVSYRYRVLSCRSKR